MNVDPPPASKRLSSVEAAVRAERVRLLFERGRTALWFNLLNALVLVVGLWDQMSRARLVGWLVAMYLVVGVRLAFWRLHHTRRDRYSPDRWARVWLVGTGVTGALWGASGLLLFPERSVGGQFLVVFLIGGMVAGASATNAASVQAFLAFAVPALLPPVIRLALLGERSALTMAGLFVLFGLGMTAVTRRVFRWLTQVIELRLRNEQLIDELQGARAELTGLNRELEARVATRTRELEKAVHDREEFVSLVSHELRTPLTSLKMNQQLLTKLTRTSPLDPEKVGRLLSVMTRQSDRMRRLVDDLLDTGRLSAERMGYVKEDVDVGALVQDTVEQLQPQLADARAELAVQLEPGLRGHWDGLRVQQVLLNLLLNALRHGQAPFALTARRTAQWVELVVRDGGKGIPPEDLGRIFQPYERGRKERGTSGLGLGLYITHRIVSDHGGRMRVESPPGAGVAFIVELPALAVGSP